MGRTMNSVATPYGVPCVPLHDGWFRLKQECDDARVDLAGLDDLASTWEADRSWPSSARRECARQLREALAASRTPTGDDDG